MTQYGFYFDSTRCTGCRTCEMACKDYNDLPANYAFRRVFDYEGGDWKDNGDGTVYGYFIVDADIDMENSNIAGVGSYNNGWIKKFSGTFDGQGHTISNFTINESNGGILSCMVEGSVFKNVSLINVINRSQSGLVVTELNGTVSNVFVQGQLLGGSANWAPGSLLVSKMADTGKIENCVVVVENFDDALQCGGALIGKFGGAS